MGSEAAVPTAKRGPDPTWEELRERFEELDSMTAMVLEKPPGWLAKADRLWWASPDGCVESSRKEPGVFEVRGCEAIDGRVTARCVELVTVGDRLERGSLIMCNKTGPRGGLGFSVRPGGPRFAALVEVGEEVIGYRAAMVPSVEPARYVSEQQRCIGGGSRSCPRAEGVVLRQRPFGERDMSDRGIAVERAAEPVDCSQPCPSADRSARERFGAWLEGKVLVDAGDQTVFRFYATREACQLAPVSTAFVRSECASSISMPMN